jgi:hypothetical protein
VSESPTENGAGQTRKGVKYGFNGHSDL